MTSAAGDSQYQQVEHVLLYLSDARARAQRGADDLQRQGAELHFVSALRQTAAELERLHRELLQATYFAVDDRQLAL